MATMYLESKQCWTIEFMSPDGKRPKVRLGKVPKRTATAVKVRVESLASAKIAGHVVDDDTTRWLAGVGDQLHDKLAAAVTTTLTDFIDACIDSRTEVKPATKEVWRQGKLGLVNCFGADRDLASITPGDADDYKQAMLTAKLAPYTIRKRLQWAKTWFKSAVRKRLIPSNPFDDVSIKATMPDRMRFVTPVETQALLDASPNHDWRTIIALARYGGMRCPSEVLSLRWKDVDWDSKRITVHSPKTEHHPGKAEREIPLFPELGDVLNTAYVLATAEGRGGQDDYVVNEKHRQAADGPNGWRNANLRTTFGKIVKRAGLEKWPRLFHNLRSSRQTELEERFPTHVVCKWLGNSEEIAKRHYLQVTDDHFDRAQSDPRATGAVSVGKGMSAPARGRRESRKTPGKRENSHNGGDKQRMGWDSNPR